MKALVLALLVFVAAVVVVNGQNCQLVVPPLPLTDTGLATPYLIQLNANSVVGCMQDITQSMAFVHGVILDTDTGAVSVYNPLVITAGTAPFLPPSRPTLPANHVVALWFGYNGGTLTLVDTPGRATSSLAEGLCVNGLTTAGALDPFGQFAYCNAPAWFEAAKVAIATGKLVVPPLGKSTIDQVTCPNVRSWDVVDQDQSDNVPTAYLVDGQTGLLAQFSAANQKQMANPTVAINPSDNVLVTKFIMPAVGCAGSVWSVPDLVDAGAMVTALPLNEIQAHYFATKPQALVPLSHAFTTTAATIGAFNPAKTNLYRKGVFQPQIATAAQGVTIPNAQANPTTYCNNLNQRGAPRITKFKATYQQTAGPMGMTLFDFLAQRFNTSNNVLNCFVLTPGKVIQNL